MKTTKSVFTILILTLGLAALSISGCSREYSDGQVLEPNMRAFSEGKPGSYWDYKTQKSVEGFILPDKAIFYSEYSAKDFNYNDTSDIQLGWELTELYWNVHFIGTRKVSEDGKDYVRFRFMAKNKKTPADIEKFKSLEQDTNVSPSEWKSATINEQARADLVKKYGESEVAAFIQKIKDSRQVVMATYAGGTIEIKESPTAQVSSNSSWGSSDEKGMVGIYQSVEPPYVMQLSYGGTVSMQNLRSNDSNTGKWFVQDGMLVTIWDSNGSRTTYNINTDGSFKSSHGILFVKTQQ